MVAVGLLDAQLLLTFGCDLGGIALLELGGRGGRVDPALDPRVKCRAAQVGIVVGAVDLVRRLLARRSRGRLWGRRRRCSLFSRGLFLFFQGDPSGNIFRC